MPAAEKYERILPAGLEAGAVIDAPDDRFSADDFHVVCNGGSLEIWLWEIDLHALLTAVDEVTGEHGGDAAVRSVHDAAAVPA